MQKHRKFTQLNQERRRRLSDLLDYGYTQSDIARKLGCHKSTISREINQNSHNGNYVNSSNKYNAIF